MQHSVSINMKFSAATVSMQLLAAAHMAAACLELLGQIHAEGFGTLEDAASIDNGAVTCTTDWGARSK